ncbi:MAG: uridine kinase, partial [Saprospiraceae bacterium]
MLIGISGGSGSGKTSFIKALRDSFGLEELAVISEDNYYKKWELQTIDKNGVINFDIPEAIDHEALLCDVNKLKNGDQVIRKEYTFNNIDHIPREI